MATELLTRHYDRHVRVFLREINRAHVFRENVNVIYLAGGRVQMMMRAHFRPLSLGKRALSSLRSVNRSQHQRQHGQRASDIRGTIGREILALRHQRSVTEAERKLEHAYCVRPTQRMMAHE